MQSDGKKLKIVQIGKITQYEIQVTLANAEAHKYHLWSFGGGSGVAWYYWCAASERWEWEGDLQVAVGLRGTHEGMRALIAQIITGVIPLQSNRAHPRPVSDK